MNRKRDRNRNININKQDARNSKEDLNTSQFVHAWSGLTARLLPRQAEVCKTRNENSNRIDPIELVHTTRLLPRQAAGYTDLMDYYDHASNDAGFDSKAQEEEVEEQVTPH